MEEKEPHLAQDHEDTTAGLEMENHILCRDVDPALKEN